MKHVIVIGGGISGLTSAVYLSKQNYKVTLIEASPKLGGKTFSIFNKNQNEYFDNGQHLMMGCYKETFNYLKIIGSFPLIEIQRKLEINFIEANQKSFKLKAPNLFYPLDLFFAVMNFKLLTVRERLKIVDFFMDLMCCCGDDLENLTVLQWLECRGQSTNSIKKFWELLAVSIMNTPAESASAQIFSEVLKNIFLNGSEGSKIVFANAGLTQLFIDPAVEFIREKEGEIILNERVTEIGFNKQTVTEIISNKRSIKNFDAVISAIPLHTFEKIVLPSEYKNLLPRIEYSPILNVHLWLRSNPFSQKFYALVDSKIHWLFNNDKHISLTISSAQKLIRIDGDELLKEICSELKKYFPIFNQELVVDWQIIKEKRATFLSDCASNRIRKSLLFNFSNFSFAGDWMNNGLPSTIEGAVLNGKYAAKSMISFLK